jgi:hypothetical protein
MKPIYISMHTNFDEQYRCLKLVISMAKELQLFFLLGTK